VISSDKDSIEFLRGLCLMAMTLNHLLLWPFVNVSFLLRLTYQSLGWWSFATVFFALAGVQWGRRTQGEHRLWHWNGLRAGMLLGWVCVATSLYILGVNLRLINPAPWQAHIAWRDIGTLFGALLGFKLPWLIDVIWLHAWLGLFAAMLWSIPLLRSSPFLIFSVSAAIWLCGIPDIFAGLGRYQIAPSWHSWTGWQFLFVICALSQQPTVKDRLDKLRKKKFDGFFPCLPGYLLL
jgi:hypothetical protein